MFDWLVETFTTYPYVGVGLVFLICGLGFPLPEEVVLISAGYVCFKNWAELGPMIASAAGAILVGDLVPFFLGHTFGSRLLRIRSLRILVNKRRLSRFDRWFRRRGDLVIFFARFVTGLRIVAYFTAGTMKMSYGRFILLDLLGIGVVAPLFILVGYNFGNIIDDAIARVQQVERGLLITVLSAAAAVALGYWLRARRRRRAAAAGPSETFVGPSIELRPEPSEKGRDTDAKSAEQ